MRHGSKTAMYFRMLYRAAMLRKGQAGAALTAIIVAAAAATAMLNLFVDVQAKLRKEFRNFGANIVVEAKPESGGFTPEQIGAIQRQVSGHGIAVPFAYAVARDRKDQPIVVAGTDFDLVTKLNPWWAVSAWPNATGQVLVGVRADRILT